MSAPLKHGLSAASLSNAVEETTDASSLQTPVFMILIANLFALEGKLSWLVERTSTNGHSMKTARH